MSKAQARVLLMNPNSNAATTAAMVAIARRTLTDVRGWTAPTGPALLSDPTALEASADCVANADLPADIDAIIVSAFGDPGRAALAARFHGPVVGIGQAAALDASLGGRPYAVVTHTPGLVSGIDTLMRASAPGGDYLGTFLTDGDLLSVSPDAQTLDSALLMAAHRAHAAGAEAVIIGGGPLGDAAARLRTRMPCTLVAPIPAAARRLLALIKDSA